MRGVVMAGLGAGEEPDAAVLTVFGGMIALYTIAANLPL